MSRDGVTQASPTCGAAGRWTTAVTPTNGPAATAERAKPAHKGGAKNERTANTRRADPAAVRGRNSRSEPEGRHKGRVVVVVRGREQQTCRYKERSTEASRSRGRPGGSTGRSSRQRSPDKPR